MNADRGLSIWERVIWMYCALLNYLKSALIKNDIPIVKNIRFKNNITVGLTTPTRNYTENLICNFIPWRPLQEELSYIYICEFGCGNLRYLNAFNDLLGRGNFKYLGIEAPGFELSSEAKDKLNDQISFMNYDLNDGVPDNIGKCNIFLSFSVLEHIDDIKKFTDSYSKKINVPAYHYHSVPTFLSVFNYMWHGCRHFNKSDFKNLLSQFKYSKEGIILYGGLATIIMHSVFITSLDVLSKLSNLSYSARYFGQKLAKKIVLKAQPLDDLTARIGIHSFCIIFWRSSSNEK